MKLCWEESLVLARIVESKSKGVVCGDNLTVDCNNNAPRVEKSREAFHAEDMKLLLLKMGFPLDLLMDTFLLSLYLFCFSHKKICMVIKHKCFKTMPFSYMRCT